MQLGLLFGFVEQYPGQMWFALYEAAMLEFDAASLSGRIADARSAMLARLGEISSIGGHHNPEREDISSALDSLRRLELLGIAP